MQGFKRTVVGILDVSYHSLKPLHRKPSSVLQWLRCDCGFTSVAHQGINNRLLRKKENNNRIKLWSPSYVNDINVFNYSIRDQHSIPYYKNVFSENVEIIQSSSCCETFFHFPLTCDNRQIIENPFLASGQIRHFHSRRRSNRTSASRDLSTQKKDETAGESEHKKDDQKPEEPVDDSQLSLYQRFKKTYKEHGKVLVGVHVLTSSVWFGCFYTAARCGIDIVPYLESWNFSDRLISPFRSGGLGDIALAYLMYKLATPARYTVTIAGTNVAIRYLRKEGKMKPVPEGDSLRELYKEGKEDLKNRSQQRMNNIKRIRGQNRRKNRILAQKKDKD